MPPIQKIRVEVPASTANLGPGFDALGMALRLYDVVEVEVVDAGLIVEVFDAGAGDVQAVPTDETHLVVRALRHACARWGFSPPGLHLRCHNAIPHGRGLGSSAAAVVSGIAAGYALAGRELDETALQLAVDFEGHADNAAASFFGGMAITWSDSGQFHTGQSHADESDMEEPPIGEPPVEKSPAIKFHAARLVPHPALRPVVAIPDVRSLTAVTRGLLPESVLHTDAAFNAGRAALLVHALTANPTSPTSPELLLAATEDRLHQEYREPAMPQSAKLVRELRARGVASTISGAGPSVLALTVNGKLPPEVDVSAFRIVELGVDLEGVRVSAR